MSIKGINHVAIICSDYAISKQFYTEVLGMTIVAENYRESRNSYKLDLAVNGVYAIELFSFSNPPKRPSYPEAAGLRHLAFSVNSIKSAVDNLDKHKIEHEDVRVDPYTGKRFVFFSDPDGLPIEFYEVDA